MPPTGVIRPKDSLPIFDQSKGRFPCFGIKEDVNKERGTQMDTQCKDGFFQQDRLNPNDNGRLRTGVNSVSIRLPQRQRSQSPTSCNPRFLQWYADWGIDDLRDGLRHGGYPIGGIERRFFGHPSATYAVVLAAVQSTEVERLDPLLGPAPHIAR
jgi:hypothetical protein